MNEEADDAAQGMIDEIFVLKVDRLLYCGREILAHEEEFLLPGVVSNDIEKPNKYGFLRRAYKYKLIGDVLYMLGADLVLRRVPWKEELYKVLEENHEGACGGHFALKNTLHKILQEGYVWPCLQKDVYHWCRSCKRCQSFGKRVLKPELRKTILAYDVFEKWGIDAVGPLPITSRGRNYILTAVDYLSRWAEAKAVRQITAKDVAKFVYEEICCKFGVPLELLSDQGPGFRAELLDFLCEKTKIACKFTTSYYPQCNGVNERFNGKLVQILSKVIENQGKNWDLEVPSALWAYRTAVKTDTGFTPFHLVYGKKALLPVEVEIPGIKMLEKVLGQSGDAFQQRLLHLWEAVTGGQRPSIKVAQNGFVVVDSTRLWTNQDDTFVFPNQCDQVFYYPMHGDTNWKYVIDVAPRATRVLQSTQELSTIDDVNRILDDNDDDTSEEGGSFSDAKLEYSSTSTDGSASEPENSFLNAFELDTNTDEIDTFSHSSIGLNLEIVLEIDHEDLYADITSVL
ncbi:hypothetical protein L7F22_038142 [Adiantum nelumboides]|nr:hypothetical protein [Adiantum nelumboides]